MHRDTKKVLKMEFIILILWTLGVTIFFGWKFTLWAFLSGAIIQLICILFLYASKFIKLLLGRFEHRDSCERTDPNIIDGEFEIVSGSDFTDPAENIKRRVPTVLVLPRK